MAGSVGAGHFVHEHPIPMPLQYAEKGFYRDLPKDRATKWMTTSNSVTEQTPTLQPLITGGLRGKPQDTAETFNMEGEVRQADEQQQARIIYSHQKCV